MSERMTGERLAEIEMHHDSECLPDEYESCELLQALKAERATLRAAGELPEKWREKYAPVVNSDGPVWRAAASDLEALLKTNDEPRTRPIQGGYLEKDTTTGEVHEPTTERDWTSDAWSK